VRRAANLLDIRSRLILTAVAALVLAALGLSTSAHAGEPPCPPGTSPDPAGLVCVLLDKAATGLDALASSSATDAAVAAQEHAWLGTALELQHRLGDALPLRDAMWVGTHNSFNTLANLPPSLSNLDSNQHVSLVDQLRLGVRGIEIDVHWTPSVWAGGADAPVVCHGRPPSELNLGCTDERLLAEELAPVGAWVRAHPGDVILLYLEDNIDQPAGYDAAAAAIDATIGDLVYRPPAGAPCELLPLALSRRDVLAAGKQIVVMSGCGGAASASPAWRAMVFDDSVRAEEGNPDFAGYPACSSPSVPATAYGTSLVRFYEDSTFVSAAVALGDPGHRLTTATIDAMVRCGVNLFGLDQVDPFDSRLVAMVWSWAPDEPSTSTPGTCALAGPDGRFHTAGCRDRRLRFACVDTKGRWFVSRAAGRADDGAKACARDAGGARYAVPGNGDQQQHLRDAAAAAGVGDVWVAYRFRDGVWQGAVPP